MAMKVSEFMRLTQGNKSMNEYLQEFNNLSRYAPSHVDTEEKKIESFKRGLNTKMAKTMGISLRTTFNAFISDCLTQENNNNLHAASKNRKRSFEGGSSQFRPPMPNPSTVPPSGSEPKVPCTCSQEECSTPSEESEGLSSTRTPISSQDWGFHGNFFHRERPVLQLQPTRSLRQVLPIPEEADNLSSPCSSHLCE